MVARKFSFLIAGFVAVILITPVYTIACSCITSYKPWIAVFSDADAVFTGRVHSVIPHSKAKRRDDDSRGDHTVTFEVIKKYKGLEPSTRLISLESDYDSSSCSFAVDSRKGPRRGEEWIIVAHRSDVPQMFFGGSCNESRKIRGKQDLINIESHAFKFSERQGVIGAVVRNYMHMVKETEVTLSGEGISKTQRVDEDGYYWFPLENPGEYTITARIPFQTSLIGAALFPKIFKVLDSETEFSYTVNLESGQFHYNEVNVNDPKRDPFESFRISDKKTR